MRKGGPGFTLVEVVVVISVMAVLAVLVFNGLGGSKEKAWFTRAKSELSIIGNAAKLYATKYNDYPDDAPAPGIPSPIMEFIDPGERKVDWPDAPWPNSLYDYDAWDLVMPGAAPDTWVKGEDGLVDTYQISIRWCTYAEWQSDPNICKKRFPQQSWASNFSSSGNAVYWCLQGYCRPSSDPALTWEYPGYCLNCGTPNNKGVKISNE